MAPLTILDFLRVYWLGGTAIVVVLDAWVAAHQHSPFVRDCLTWGKLKDNVPSKAQEHEEDKKSAQPLAILARVLNVPKRWFLHFYLVGTLWNAFLVLSFCGAIDGKWLTALLNLDATRLLAPTGNSTLSPLEPACLLALVMMLVQTSRRLYESAFVSVFSSRARMHVLHYIVGVTFYVCNSMTIVAESHHGGSSAELRPLNAPLALCGAALFVFASVHQHQCARILASLRASPSSSERYMVPRGDWFELVSSPHYFAEILIYSGIALAIDATAHRTWLLVLLFVAVNQITAAELSHRWYRKTFADYPRGRRRLIPYVY